MANGYDEADSLEERAAIAKETSLEQRAKFLENHAPTHFTDNDRFSSILSELINEEKAVPVTIVVCDIRGSTDLMRNSISKGTYASIITSFIEQSKEIIISDEHGGWFDTFTGDGFVSFWIPEVYAEADDLDDIIVTESEERPHVSDQLLPALRQIFKLYVTTIDTMFEKTSKSVPVHTGLSFGIDSGEGVFVPTPTSDRITLIGDPYVGAVRAEGNAPPYTVAIGSYPGARLWELRDELREQNGMLLEKAVIHTKEYPAGQQIYLLRDREVEQTLEEHAMPIESSREKFIERKNIDIIESGY